MTHLESAQSVLTTSSLLSTLAVNLDTVKQA